MKQETKEDEIEKIKKETAKYIINEMILPNTNTNIKEYEAVERYRREQIEIKNDILKK